MTDTALAPERTPLAGWRGALRGFGPLGIVALLLIFAGALVFMPAAAVLILIWAWITRSWHEIGLTRPTNWAVTIVAGVVLGIGMKFLMKAVVLPALGAPPVNAYFHDVAGNWQLTLQYFAFVIVGAGFAEELFFRGYLFERSAKLFGKGFVATALTLIVVSLLFAAGHWRQGWSGMANAGIVGSFAALIFLATGRNLWLPIVMHATFDVTAIAIIYLDLESKIAHLVFT